MSETRTFHIQIVSPIHIGCDEVYDPMSFVIDEQRDILIAFDLIDFLRGLKEEERKRFSNICSKGTVESILEIYKFMRGRKASGYEVKIPSGLKQHYVKTLSLSLKDTRKIQQELNNFTISRTVFNPNTNQPYIPGSSIKGALRTAWLNRKQAEKRLPKLSDARKARNLEKELLGGEFETDPFRMVKVSDFMPAGNVCTRISYAVNEKKQQTKFKAKGPSQILEVIEPGSIFSGSITIDAPPDKSGIISPIEMQSLMNSATRFYASEKIREDGELSKIGISPVKADIPEKGLILRLGRHSGAESLTLEGHRSIKIMKGKGERPGNLDHATTIWLSSDLAKTDSMNGLQPFGWVVFAPGELIMPSLAEPVPKREIEPEPVKAPQPEKSEVEKLLDELSRIKPDDMGRLGTVIQNIEKLEKDNDRAAVAKAIKDKLGLKAYKRHKRREYLDGLIIKGKE
ncbi:MAG: type III-A CRISPR-associated RAMP protein Csm5 [Deltaproteobacteria bacterium]|nr:type III-A CRISPR-associated RAMP protein Csm5 [Deltaproteobacteria bacterium]